MGKVRSDAKIYRKAAEAITLQVVARAFSCIAIKKEVVVLSGNLEDYTGPLAMQMEKQYSELMAPYPFAKGAWLHNAGVPYEEMPRWRVLALLFMAEVVEWEEMHGDQL